MARGIQMIAVLILAVSLGLAQSPAVLDERITRERELREKLELTVLANFKAQEAAARSALEAQKALTDAAFASSEKAIAKSEAALADYKTTANEFRAALADYQKNMLTRTEADIRFKSVSDKFDQLFGVFVTITLAIVGMIITIAIFLFRKKTEKNLPQ